MTGLALGLMLGAGLFLVWSSFWVPPAERRVTRNRLRDRLADEIVQSGIPGLGVGTLIAFALGTFAIVFVIFQLVVGAAPLALCFALMAGWSPIFRDRAAISTTSAKSTRSAKANPPGL